MDPKLAAIYGTNEDADLEKLAAAELAEGLADDDQLDTDGLSEDDLEAIAQDVLSGGDESSEEEGSGNIDGDDAQEKLAEADYLGRVMARSYVNELRGIDKEAAKGEGFPGLKKHQKQVAKGEAMAKRVIPDAKKESKSLMNKIRTHGKSGINKGMAKSEEFGRKGTQGIKGGVEKMLASPEGEVAKHRAGQAGRALKRGAGHVADFAVKHQGKGLLAGGALALGGAGYAAKKHMDKQSSALETLIEARAQEILAESGIDADELELMDGQEKVSDPREALADAVEQRAWDLLGQFGVVPNEE